MRKINVLIFCIFVFGVSILWGVKNMSYGQDFKIIIEQLFPDKSIQKLTNIEIVAKNWTEVFLEKKYLPNENIRYVFLPGQKEKDVDKVVIRYSVGEEVITITQTLSIFAIQIDLPKNKSVDRNVNKQELTVNTVEVLAKKIFNKSTDIELNLIKEATNRIEGNVNSQNEIGPWFHTMSWWQEGDSIGFYFLKNDGMPSSSTKGFGFSFNAGWFSNSQKSRIVSH